MIKIFLIAIFGAIIITGIYFFIKSIFEIATGYLELKELSKQYKESQERIDKLEKELEELEKS